jgi:CBS domain-containing protein
MIHILMATLEELMTRVVLTTEPGQKMGEARKLMKQAAVRHLAVVDREGLLVGMLSSHDFLADDRRAVAEAMSNDPVSIAIDARASEAVVKLLQHQISSLPVLDVQGKLVGIVTSTDLLIVAYDALAEAEGGLPSPPLRIDVANVVLRAKLERVSRASGPHMTATALRELRRHLQRSYDRRQAEDGPFAEARAARPSVAVDIAELCEQQALVLERTDGLISANASLADKGTSTVAAGSDELVADVEKLEKREREILGPHYG